MIEDYRGLIFDDDTISNLILMIVIFSIFEDQIRIYFWWLNDQDPPNPTPIILPTNKFMHMTCSCHPLVCMKHMGLCHVYLFIFYFYFFYSFILFVLKNIKSPTLHFRGSMRDCYIATFTNLEFQLYKSTININVIIYTFSLISHTRYHSSFSL